MSRDELLELELAGMKNRIRLARLSVGASPFYTLAQREAVVFVLDLIEFNEPRALAAKTEGEKG